MAISKVLKKEKEINLNSTPINLEDEVSLFTAIVASSDDAVIGKNLDGLIISWNKGAENHYGYRAEEIIGKSVSLLIPKDRTDEFSKFLATVKKGESVVHYETKRLHKDGRLIDVSVSLFPIRDSVGKIIGAAAITRSVADYKQSVFYTHSFIEASLDPLFIISVAGKITEVNTATTKVTGVKMKELVESNFINYFTEPEKAREAYQRAFAEGAVIDFPLTIHHAEGKFIDVLFNASVYKDDKGNVLGVLAAVRDITASKKALFYARSVIEAGLDPMITISPEGKVTDVNEATVSITGVPREKIIGSDFITYFTDQEKATVGYRQVFKEGFVREYPLTIHNISGALTDVLYNASVYKDDKGNVFGAIAALRDVTESKKALFYARSVIEAGLDPMITISPEGKVTDVNEATVSITGVPREKIIGSDFTIYFTDPEEVLQGNQQLFKEGFIREYPLIIRGVSGALIDVLYNASVYKDDKGNVFGAIAALRDVTTQKKSEEQLHETSAYARSLIEASLDPLFVINPEGKITGVNHATEGVTGVTREWLVDTDFSTYFTEPHKARASYREVLKKGEVRDYPLAIHHASGKITDVSFNASVYKDALGAVRGIFAVARDVTETKKLSQYARSLIEASRDPLFTISLDGKIMDMNEATVRVAGVPYDKLIGTDFLNYFTNSKEAQEGYEKMFKQGFVIDYPLTIKSRTGKTTDVLFNASVYKDLKGNVLGATAVARDNTRAKQATEAIELVNKEMEAFSSSVSHDLRAPLRVIDGFAKMLAEDYSEKLDDEGKRIITNIRESSEQMRILIEDLLAFSRLGLQEIKKEDVDMDILVQGVFDELKKAVPERDIKFNMVEMPNSRADRDTLRMVWSNLLSNAIKYTRPKKEAAIEIGSKIEADKITYYIKDNGVGFDMKYVDKLFNVFQRLNSMEEFEGTGIGLANVKRIIERHGGNVWAEGKLGEGSTFYFTLPKV
jgi:PAS domain S-box-containing protein